MSSTASSARFQRALDQLQYELKILPVGISEAGAWRYAFIYDILPRHFPDLEAKSHSITEMAARDQILLRFVTSLGETNLAEVKRFFGWKENTCINAVQRINESHDNILTLVEHGNHTIILLTELLTN